MLTALENLPKGVTIDFTDLLDSGLFEAIDLPENEKAILERFMLETSSGRKINFETLKSAGVIDSLDVQ